jgi:hypothetical protein
MILINKLFRITSDEFDLIGQLLIINSTFVIFRYVRRNGTYNAMQQYSHYSLFAGSYFVDPQI